MSYEPIEPIDPNRLDPVQVLMNMQLALMSGDVRRAIDKGEIVEDQLEDIADLIYEHLHGEAEA